MEWRSLLTIENLGELAFTLWLAVRFFYDRRHIQQREKELRIQSALVKLAEEQAVTIDILFSRIKPSDQARAELEALLELTPKKGQIWSYMAKKTSDGETLG